ncbi:hypothetical protein ACHFCA_21455 [Delftia tsuruhatensis]
MAQPASLRTSAQIIPLPGAAAAPVINPKRGPGRPPKNVIGIWQGRFLGYQRREREKAADQAALLETYSCTPSPWPTASGAWPFCKVGRQDFDVLNEGDRMYIELAMMGLVAVRKAEARHV